MMMCSDSVGVLVPYDNIFCIGFLAIKSVWTLNGLLGAWSNTFVDDLLIWKWLSLDAFRLSWMSRARAL